LHLIQDSLPFTADSETIAPAVAADIVDTVIRRADLYDDWRYRALDYGFIVMAAPFVLPTLAVIALWVKIDDPQAPVFYSQTRYGKNGKPFKILKIRTMVRDADKIKATLLAESEDKGAGFKLDQDPRVTRPGRTLRKLYLDELAQLWNVLCGDMSIVGPRANSADPSGLQPWQRLRLLVRPGLTGSWQVMRNKPRDFNERCRIDLEYIAKKSIIHDLGILLKTVSVVLIKPTGC
jgi:lipopolysaccharide/colanic/teichoic acid biosynthesis glycosyltransferase